MVFNRELYSSALYFADVLRFIIHGLNVLHFKGSNSLETVKAVFEISSGT